MHNAENMHMLTLDRVSDKGQWSQNQFAGVWNSALSTF